MPSRVTLGPGDDMGAVRLDGRDLLVTVDQLADGVHFKIFHTPLHLIARKAIVRNLSDVAAMAGSPVGAVAAVSLPRDFGQDRANALFDSMRAVAMEYDCPLIGGDISMWDSPLLITVTVFAEPAGLGPIQRSGAVAGDSIYVTGELGGAWDEQGGGPHLQAEPRLTLARSLAESLGSDLHSMIDLSDGLAQDLGHICTQSDVDACLDVASIPCRHGVDVKRALTDGEDYELCFSASADAVVPHEMAGIPLTCVGQITKQAGAEPRVFLRNSDGSEQNIDRTGWEHHG